MPDAVSAAFPAAGIRKARMALTVCVKSVICAKCRMGLNGQMLRRSSNCGLKRFSMAKDSALRFDPDQAPRETL
jgi:hypothetical protein